MKRIDRPGEIPPPPATREAGPTALRLLMPLLVLGVAWLGWEAVARLSQLPAFILPSPQLVGQRALRACADGSLLRHTWVTLYEVLLGLGLGAFFAFLFGYPLAKSEAAERFLVPYIVASQAIPSVAIAPLLIIWLGPGMLSKVLISALIVFFPVLVNTVVGLRSVEANLRELMRSLTASRWQTFRYLEVPAALPVLLGGLKVGATLSVIGAVVGEFVGSDRGLGFLINLGRQQYDTALVFVGIFSLIIMALALYGAVAWAERVSLAWRA
jgi:NitT/TauT family transport system permease protein